MKKKLLSAVLAATLVALVGINVAGVSAAPAQAAQTFSVAVHFEYENGFNYDYVLERGVEASDVFTILQACGKAHRAPSVVWYHCFVIPE